jgi:hypothetical protein
MTTLPDFSNRCSTVTNNNGPERPSFSVRDTRWLRTVGRLPRPVIVQPQQPLTVRLQVSSAPQGSTVIHLSLTSANGTPLAFTDTQLTVLSTRYGRAILFLIGAAIGVLVLTSVYRGVRRRLHDDAHVANQKADPPGSVVTGTSDALHPTEAPDDLADARRWVDDA